MPTFRPVTLDELALAPIHVHVESTIPAPRQRVFDLFTGDPARWGDFLAALDHNGRWLSGDGGVGSVRRIGRGSIGFTETILASDDGKRWTFRVDEATLPLAKALIEDYAFEDAGDGCLLRWTGAVWPIGPVGLARPALTAGLGLLVRNLAKGVERAAA
jgi:hypothetical protein